MCDPNWDFFPRLLYKLKTGTYLPDDDIDKLIKFIDEVYLDGWSDGVAHKTNLTPIEHSERITEDLECSWWRLVSEYEPDFGPQKSPSSVSKVNAEARQAKKAIDES